MQQVTPVISRKERILFDLLQCANELYDLRSELSILDVDDIEHQLKKLRSTVREIQRQPNQVFQLSV